MFGQSIADSLIEQLASEVPSYSPLDVEPLPISPWLAMSLLQKSIRRDEIGLASKAAATLLSIAPDKFWRRSACIAYEDIGVADLSTVALTTMAISGKRLRKSIGGDLRVANYLVSLLCRSNKCRSADDLLMIADRSPAFKRARAELAGKPTPDLIKISVGNAKLPVRALAVWYGVGTHPRQTRMLEPRRGEPNAVFQGLSDGGLPHSMVEIARLGFAKLSEPLCAFVALLAGSHVENEKTADDVLPPATDMKGVPCWAFDNYVREGRQALIRFPDRDCASTLWLREFIPPNKRLGFLGDALFRVEGGLVKRRLQWATGTGLREAMDDLCAGDNAIDFFQCVRGDLELLNEERHRAHSLSHNDC